jgi:hypothetical protein
MSYPEPHEGITGVARAGDGILESESASSLAAVLASHLHRATLVGNPAPMVAEMNRRMLSPQPGDRVVVLDSMFRQDPVTRFQGVGHLVAVREEWASTAAQWAAEMEDDLSLTDEARWIERNAWYIQYGPEPVDICRWTNCQVIAFPGPGERW